MCLANQRYRFYFLHESVSCGAVVSHWVHSLMSAICQWAFLIRRWCKSELIETCLWVKLYYRLQTPKTIGVLPFQFSELLLSTPFQFSKSVSVSLIYCMFTYLHIICKCVHRNSVWNLMLFCHWLVVPYTMQLNQCIKPVCVCGNVRACGRNTNVTCLLWNIYKEVCGH